MMIHNFETFFFFLLSSFILASALFVVTTKNPIHALLYFISIYLSVMILLLMLRLEFFAFIFLIIYVGAIAIVFLFIVMMVDVDQPETINLENQFDLKTYIPIILLIIIIFSFITPIFFSEIMPFSTNIWSNIFDGNLPPIWFTKLLALDKKNNLESLGEAFFTYYSIYFLLAGIILFIALVGVAFLTIKKKPKKLKNQEIFQQISRNTINSSMKIDKKK